MGQHFEAKPRCMLMWCRFTPEIDELVLQIEPNPTECVFHLLQAMTDMDPLAIVLSVDGVGALANIDVARVARR